MHRRFSFVTTVIIMLAIVFLVGFIPYGLIEFVGIQVPTWIATPLAFLGIYISLEIAARLGPKAFDTKLDEMVGEHKHYRNKIAMMLFILVPITLIEFQRAHQNINSFWHGLFIFLVGMVLGYLVALVVGTPDFRKSLLPKPLRGQR
ncbi:MAG: hypothetical protein IT327_16385 [Anaerolineae bacterium]|jgi:uncharacterized membrane protein YfcA|nr:hypothetical protein [Anaerolineae bacterium]